MKLKLVVGSLVNNLEISVTLLFYACILVRRVIRKTGEIADLAHFRNNRSDQVGSFGLG